jgi:hypothetical protein
MNKITVKSSGILLNSAALLISRTHEKATVQKRAVLGLIRPLPHSLIFRRSQNPRFDLLALQDGKLLCHNYLMFLLYLRVACNGGALRRV